MSFLRNPFCGFKSRFKLYALQYSVSRKVEGEERGDGLAIDGPTGDLTNGLVDDPGDVVAGLLEVSFGEVAVSLSH